MTMSEETVRSVVEQVVAQLRVAMPLGTPSTGRGRTGSAGVHGSVDDAVAAAKEAFEAFQRKTIDDRRRAIQCIRDICIQQCDPLGRMEMDETKIGRVDHKIEKLVTAGEKTPGVEWLKTDSVSGDIGLTVREYAPFGVIAAITPVTHSLPTLASNSISMLAGGNTVVFNAHPSGANIAKHGVRLFNEAIRSAIGIDNLITIIDPPTIESAEALFKHRDARLLVVTGGPAVARAALASPKRAIVAGPGNPPVVVDETACLERAAKSIVFGTAYDNNLLCIGEKEVFAVHSIFESLLSAMSAHGGYRLTDSQIRDLERVVFSPASDGSGKTVLNKEYVGKDPADLAKAIGLSIPSGIQVLFGETGEESPFVDHEQMTTFLPFVRVSDVNAGIALAKKYEHNYRHTAVMHSRNVESMTRMARAMDTTLFIQNAPSTAGLGGTSGEGHLSFSIATPTGEGVTSPLTFTRQRRSTIGGGAMRILG
ncbi:MAG: aldehyde dehydrogenase family protein [Planctomycetota bacterium]